MNFKVKLTVRFGTGLVSSFILDEFDALLQRINYLANGYEVHIQYLYATS